MNVSVRKKGETAFGERCEIKNVNSMKFARQAIEFEAQRQIGLLESGGQVHRSTLNFDPATGTTSPMRDKEDAHDYRYFPDPDLPPVLLTEERMADIRSQQPMLPQAFFEKFTTELGLPENDAELLTAERAVAEYFSDLSGLKSLTGLGRPTANLVINKILPHLSEAGISIDQFPVPQAHVAQFVQLVDEGKVTASIAYQRLFPALVEQPDTPPLQLAEQLNLLQSSDENFLEKIVDEVLAANPDEVAAYRGGKRALVGFFMGQVMKASKGKAEPKATNALLLQKLKG